MTPRTRLAVALLALTALTRLEAGQARPLNIVEMTQRAETIFSGRCLEMESEVDPVLNRPVTRLRFGVSRATKGQPGEEVTIRLLGHPMNGGHAWSIAGLPTFDPDEEVVLFLYGVSRSGLTSPVGLGQGKFTVTRDKLGRATARNPYGNSQLFQRLSDAERRQLQAIAPDWGGGKQIPTERLLDMTVALGQ